MSPDPAGFELLHEDDTCLVILKPAGVLTQAPPGIDSLENRVRRLLAHRAPSSAGFYLSLPHRLDRPVSGVMVLARCPKAARRMSQQFENRKVVKKYWAVVEGEVAEDQGTWTDYLRKTAGEARAEVVAADHPDGRIAVLHFVVLQRSGDRTWLEIELETGRTHQIRVQAASRSLPVLGDRQYGARHPFGTSWDNERLREIALHARSLSIRHPTNKLIVDAQGAAGSSWEDLPFPIPRRDSQVQLREGSIGRE